MRISPVFRFMKYGIRTILLKKKEPILGTIILTDRCNLSCKHCAVNNVHSIIYPYSQIRREMQVLYDMGVRILFFSGGETYLWTHSGKGLRDLVIEAKQMGFVVVNIATNGTFPLDIPEANLVLLSVDGDRETHDSIRGETYDMVLHNLRTATAGNILIYTALNKLNKHAIRDVCELAKNEENVRAVSFNLHTPYPGTEALSLSQEEKVACCDEIVQLMKAGYPILNLRSVFPYLVNNKFPMPCHQCVVIENGAISECARCISYDGLCEKCGYLFVAEYTLIFSGHIPVVWDMLRTYPKYI